MDNRTIAGTVNPDATIKHGQEFSVAKVAVGRYLVSFRPAFAQIFGGSGTAIRWDGDTRENLLIMSLTANEAHVKTARADGVATDYEFTFTFTGVGSVPVKD